MWWVGSRRLELWLTVSSVEDGVETFFGFAAVGQNAGVVMDHFAGIADTSDHGHAGDLDLVPAGEEPGLAFGGLQQRLVSREEAEQAGDAIANGLLR